MSVLLFILKLALAGMLAWWLLLLAVVVASEFLRGFRAGRASREAAKPAEKEEGL